MRCCWKNLHGVFHLTGLNNFESSNREAVVVQEEVSFVLAHAKTKPYFLCIIIIYPHFLLSRQQPLPEKLSYLYRLCSNQQGKLRHVLRGIATHQLNELIHQRY